MNDEQMTIARVLLQAKINAGYSQDEAKRYVQLVEKWGENNVFDTDELTENFSVKGFMAPFVVVQRKSDGVKGTLTFTHMPRFYFDFQEE